MTTLVTGGRGFVGRHLVDHLLAGGEQVVDYNRDHAVDERPGLTTVQGELFDVPRLVRTLTAHGVERVVHTAGMSHPGVSIDMPIGTFAADVEGTVSGHLEQWDRQGRFGLSAAERDLGYRPRWSFEDGLRATIAWVRAHEQAGAQG